MQQHSSLVLLIFVTIAKVLLAIQYMVEHISLETNRKNAIYVPQMVQDCVYSATDS